LGGAERVAASLSISLKFLETDDDSGLQPGGDVVFDREVALKCTRKL
jgi:hypothetical protein